MEDITSILTDIMDAITEAPEWGRRQMEDPVIIDAEKRQSRALDKARAYLPADIFNELDNSSTRISSAYGDAGIMYGLYIATSTAELLKKIGGNPFRLMLKAPSNNTPMTHSSISFWPCISRL